VRVRGDGRRGGTRVERVGQGREDGVGGLEDATELALVVGVDADGLGHGTAGQLVEARGGGARLRGVGVGEQHADGAAVDGEVVRRRQALAAGAQHGVGEAGHRADHATRGMMRACLRASWCA
jgi:hypothetical protein